MKYHYPIRLTVDMDVDNQIDVEADWALCRTLISDLDLTVFAKMICLQMFGHADLDAVEARNRLSLICECQPAIAQAKLLPELWPKPIARQADHAGSPCATEIVTEPNIVPDALWRAWADHGGLMTEALLPLHRHLIINSSIVPPGDAPEILFLGADSMACRVFGESVIRNCAFRQVPDRNLRSRAHDGYVNAATGEPTRDSTTHRTSLLASETIEVSYERLILPFHTRSSAQMLVTHCLPRQAYRLRAHKSRTNRPAGSRDNTFRAGPEIASLQVISHPAGRASFQVCANTFERPQFLTP